MGAAPGMDRVRTKVQWATTLHSRVPYTPGYPTLQRGSAAAAGAAWIEEGPSPCRGEAFISITRHDERQSLVTEQSILRDDDPARPDSDTTVQYAPGQVLGHCRRRVLSFGTTKGAICTGDTGSDLWHD